MKINQTDIFNTGGNCMVLVIAVEDGGDLKSIMINDESIVGYSVQDPFEDADVDLYDLMLWEAAHWDELLNCVSLEFAAEVRKAFIKQWPYSDNMDNGQLLDMYNLNAGRLHMVKLETFKPYRQTVKFFPVADSDITVQERNYQVYSFIVDQLKSLERYNPEVTEYRWEYLNVGQGHYIRKFFGEWTAV